MKKNILFLLILSYLLIFSKSFGITLPDHLFISESETMHVERLLGERDIVLFAKFSTTKSENNIVANQIRSKLKSLLLEKDNLMPIFEEDVGGLNLDLHGIKYEDLKEKNIGYLLNGEIEYEGNSIKLKLTIWDVYKLQKILEQDFYFLANEIEFFLPKLATQVYEFFTGEFGFFYGKLLYTISARPGVKPFKKVIMSSKIEDTIKAVAFTNGDDITFNPIYCKNNQEILFTSQKPKQRSKIIIANRITGLITPLKLDKFFKNTISFFSTDISQNCNKVVFSVAENGSTKIYLFDREINRLKLLTPQSKAINTAPFFFGDDKKIIFVSDNTGRPKLWSMNIDGTNRQLITKQNGSYYSPSVSSDNQKIAFVKVKSGKFSLGIANIDGSEEELIHSAFLIENPKWTPVGKTILFSMKNSRNDQSKIYSISLNGREPKLMQTLKGNLNEPSWVEEF